jgi:hypothetical protein
MVTRQIWALAGTTALVFGLAGIFAGVGQGGTRVPHGFTAQEWKAIELRSEALNQKYHLGAYRKVNADSAQAERALMVRGDALNRKYHLGRYKLVHATRASSGFDWADAGIGSAATLGLVLAAVGTIGLVKRKSTAHDQSPVAI